MRFTARFAGLSGILLASSLLLTDVGFGQPGPARRGADRRVGEGSGQRPNLPMGPGRIWEFLAEKYDKNQDGKLTPAEYDRGAETFRRLDTNRDGVLTRDDWAGGRGRPGGNRPLPDLTRGVAPQVGQVAPDFELAFVSNPENKARLSSFAGKKPVALIFGSCT